MEEIPGIPGLLPPLAPMPSHSVRLNILPEEWQACLDAWIFATEFRLRLLPDHFRRIKLSSPASGVLFLLTYCRECAYHSKSEKPYMPRGDREIKLHQQSFLLLRRLLLETDLPYDCPSGELFALLANSSIAFNSIPTWRDTLRIAWKNDPVQISDALETCKKSLIQELPQTNANDSGTVQLLLRQATGFIRSLPEAGMFFMIGSDYLDSLFTGYMSSRISANSSDLSSVQRDLTANLYMCLMSLTSSIPPRTSLLLDHLYSLKSSADQSYKANANQPTALSSLVCTTSFLRHLDSFLATNEQKRGHVLLAALRSCGKQTSHLHALPILKKSKVQRGKGKSIQNGDMHVHQASRVSQIHELFPDLPSTYILRLLDFFSDNVEAVTAALLEPESLPSSLQDSGADAGKEQMLDENIKDLSPQPPPSTLPQRRNIFDGDEFDNLRISSSNIHMGRKEKIEETATGSSAHAKSKAAIMAALAAFDSDDDERDDTYDAGDVGGTVDHTLDTDSPSRAQDLSVGQGDAYEELLFGAWRNTPHIFSRDSKTRISQPRQKLKEETGMSDEQIEGWAVMLRRDNAMLARLEKKYSLAFAFGGNQHKLAGTKWSASRSGTATEEEESGDDGNGQAGGGNRGRGGLPSRGSRGFGRGRGSTAGPTHDASTQAARKRKEQGRGRGGANHNRREGRAKKIGRGMAGVVM